MNDILINVISIVVTSVVIPLISIGGTQLIRLINSKIKNNEVNKHLTLATEIVINAVRSVFQTYVESLKAEGKFDQASQIQALTKAKDIALSQMNSEVKKFIEDNYGDINNWLNIQIEASINCLKNR
ncbi:MAG: phage holin, LLH family [Bacilli bacterium]|nr:phage holin, LLH family [Bacilli bacterium]